MCEWTAPSRTRTTAFPHPRTPFKDERAARARGPKGPSSILDRRPIGCGASERAGTSPAYLSGSHHGSWVRSAAKTQRHANSPSSLMACVQAEIPGSTWERPPVGRPAGCEHGRYLLLHRALSQQRQSAIARQGGCRTHRPPSRTATLIEPHQGPCRGGLVPATQRVHRANGHRPSARAADGREHSDHS